MSIRSDFIINEFFFEFLLILLFLTGDIFEFIFFFELELLNVILLEFKILLLFTFIDDEIFLLFFPAD